MQAKVKGRVALIAGANDEIGGEIALRLATAGATVVLCGNDLGKLDAFVQRIIASGGTASAMAVEMSDPKAIGNCVVKIIASHGKIDILVNNGPDAESKALADLTAEDFATTLRCSLASQFHFLREVVPIMQKNNGGRVINISGLPYLGIPKFADAAAAKSALFGLTRSIALEVARSNITVNCVVKGDIAEINASEEQLQKIASGIPVKRVGTPADVSYAVGFFASDTSDYVTGQTFFVCGGKSNYFSMSV
jgi:3-oxoacyl-[acyl-carrier protein] reductase/2-[hydroxy(phenyl)methyl]-succinyl-CoA dehydrogenase BbsC subunit